MDAVPGGPSVTWSLARPLVAARLVSEGGSEVTMTDDDLLRDVAAELYWDSAGGQPGDRDIGRPHGHLRGTVASLHKRAGATPPGPPRGSPGRHELRVQIPDRDRRDDEDAVRDVLEALMLEDLCR